jgi:hypothetical protein
MARVERAERAKNKSLTVNPTETVYRFVDSGATLWSSSIESYSTR